MNQHIVYPIVAIHESGFAYTCWTAGEFARLCHAGQVWDIGAKHVHQVDDGFGRRPWVERRPWLLRDDTGTILASSDVLPDRRKPRRNWCKQRGHRMRGDRRTCFHKARHAAEQAVGDWPEHARETRRGFNPQAFGYSDPYGWGFGERKNQRSWKSHRKTRWKTPAAEA